MEEDTPGGAKRPPEDAASEAADDGASSKHAKVDLNPLTGNPYTRRFYELLEQRQQLPAWGAREEFLRLMQKHQVVLLVGETGSGKTTQLPQILLDAGYHVQGGSIKSLACIQPHELAATSAASRIAEELEVPVGSCVGYHIRFDDKTSPDTLLRLVSAEALLQEALVDRLLQRYSVLLFDEAHLRTVAVDALLGYLKQLLPQRPELRLVVMAPSLEIRKLQGFFPGAPLLQMPGKVFPVDVLHTSIGEKNYLKAAVSTVLQIHDHQPEGDILLFLVDEEDVEQICVQLRREAVRHAEAGELVPVPLHPTVTAAQMQQVFAPAPGPKALGGKPGRKVVVATGLAETSIAVDGIVYVVDPGFEAQRFYDPRTRLDSRLVAPVSRAGAERRAKRAGRHCLGKCFRLYPEKAVKEQLLDVVHPEIVRSNLAGTVLALKRLGVDNFVNFDFIDAPPPELLMRALELLGNIGCLDECGDMTEVGGKISRFPVEPLIAKMLVGSPEHRCSNEALSIASMLSVGPVFLRPSGGARQADEARSRFAHLDGDHLTMLNVFHAYKQHVQDGVDPIKFCGENYINPRALAAAERIREKLKACMDQLGLALISTNFQDKDYYPNIRRCLLSAFFTQVAYLDKEKEKLGLYVTMREALEVSLHPCTSLTHKPEWIVFHDVCVTSKPLVRTITEVRGEWLLDIAPSYYDPQKFPKNESRTALEKLLRNRD